MIQYLGQRLSEFSGNWEIAPVPGIELRPDAVYNRCTIDASPRCRNQQHHKRIFPDRDEQRSTPSCQENSIWHRHLGCFVIRGQSSSDQQYFQALKRCSTIMTRLVKGLMRLELLHQAASLCLNTLGPTGCIRMHNIHARLPLRGHAPAYAGSS